jgi:hypothetical protein
LKIAHGLPAEEAEALVQDLVIERTSEMESLRRVQSHCFLCEIFHDEKKRRYFDAFLCLRRHVIFQQLNWTFALMKMKPFSLLALAGVC